mmetsp:Transcript_34568/g.87823  ORF Transcript_34568/g.87823 Transcript_34568/m.87823 type:complete len:247 (-) Transcript_34568:194-934(-)
MPSQPRRRRSRRRRRCRRRRRRLCLLLGRWPAERPAEPAAPSTPSELRQGLQRRPGRSPCAWRRQPPSSSGSGPAPLPAAAGRRRLCRLSVCCPHGPPLLTSCDPAGDAAAPRASASHELPWHASLSPHGRADRPPRAGAARALLGPPGRRRLCWPSRLRPCRMGRRPPCPSPTPAPAAAAAAAAGGHPAARPCPLPLPRPAPLAASPRPRFPPWRRPPPAWPTAPLFPPAFSALPRPCEIPRAPP